MGQDYSCYLHIVPKDERALVEALRKFKEEEAPRLWGYIRWDWERTETLEDCLRCFLSNQNFTHVDKHTWTSDFHGSYSWQEILWAMFDTMAPYLQDGSEFSVAPDYGYTEKEIRDGRVVVTDYDDGEDGESTDCD